MSHSIHKPTRALATAALLGLSLTACSSHAETPPAAEPEPYIFHHWDMRLDGPITHVTEGLWLSNRSPSTELQEEIQTWLDRGVIPQRWRGGTWSYEQGFNTPETLAQHWAEPAADGWPGIVIDEITVNEDVRTVAGPALIRLRELQPDLHIAVYIVPGITNEHFIRGLQEAADSVLVEAYLPNARNAYGMIRRRADSIVENDLMPKSVIVLGFGPEWITTQRELRRQLHFLRHTYPDMRGVAVYGHLNDFNTDWFEPELHRFYTAPVLHVADIGEGRAQVQNISRSPSPEIQMHFAAKPGDTSRTSAVTVRALQPGQSTEIRSPRGFPHPLTVFHENYSVLGPVPTWGEEPAYLREGANAPWPTADFGSVREITEPAEGWELHRNDDGHIESATLPLDLAEGGSIDFSATIHPDRISLYGPFEIRLEDSDGKSKFSLGLRRNENERNAYWHFETTGDESVTVTEGIAYEIASHMRHKIRVFHSAGDHLRVALFDPENNTTLWDSGTLPFAGTLRFDQLRLTVSGNAETSEIAWQPDGSLLMRSSPRAPNAPTELTLTDIRLKSE